jgi:Pentapeptide repeats (8 copies)/LytTr DNA-binding domain
MEKKRISQRELDFRLKEHKIWCETNGAKGNTLSLPSYDLSGLSFSKAQLRGANLTQCDLTNCDFREANLNSINVTESNFSGANLSGANIVSADFKYITLNENTCFDDCDYEGLMIDLPTADLLPTSMDMNVMQIIEEFRFVTNILLPTEHANIGRGILEDLADILQFKYPQTDFTTKRKNQSEIEISIDARSQEDRDKIEQDIFVYGRVMKGETPLGNLIDEPLLVQRIELSNKFRHLQLTMQNQQLQESNLVSQTIETSFASLYDKIANQLKNNLLPAGPNVKEHGDFYIILPNGNKKTIDTEQIVFIEKTVDNFPTLHLSNGESFTFDEPLNSVASRLLIVRPTIITVHKSFIVNIKYVNKKINKANNYEIYTFPYPEKALLVGQNHKNRFKDMLAQHRIIVNEE